MMFSEHDLADDDGSSATTTRPHDAPASEPVYVLKSVHGYLRYRTYGDIRKGGWEWVPTLAQATRLTRGDAKRLRGWDDAMIDEARLVRVRSKRRGLVAPPSAQAPKPVPREMVVDDSLRCAGVRLTTSNPLGEVLALEQDRHGTTVRWRGSARAVARRIGSTEPYHCVYEALKPTLRDLCASLLEEVKQRVLASEAIVDGTVEAFRWREDIIPRSPLDEIPSGVPGLSVCVWPEGRPKRSFRLMSVFGRSTGLSGRCDIWWPPSVQFLRQDGVQEDESAEPVLAQDYDVWATTVERAVEDLTNSWVKPLLANPAFARVIRDLAAVAMSPVRGTLEAFDTTRATVRISNVDQVVFFWAMQRRAPTTVDVAILREEAHQFSKVPAWLRSEGVEGYVHATEVLRELDDDVWVRLSVQPIGEP